MQNQKMLLITHPKSHLHVQPFPRPNLEAFEAPLRTQMAEHYLSECGISTKLEREKAPKATAEDILKVHSPYLLETVRLMSNLGSGNLGEAAYASPDLLRNALASAGGAIRAAERVTEGVFQHAFSLMRPPGHHASRSTPAGLCYFNNVALAVTKVMEKKSIERVTIVDFDDHFGNGTAEIFYANPNVQYISIHEYDYENFGIGHYEEFGYGEAVGSNINIPLIDGSSDMVYKQAMDRIIVPSIKSFKPHLLAVSAGLDTHYADPVGNMNVDTSTYWEYGKALGELVKELDMVGSFSVLEGGYNPLVTGPSIHAYIMGLLQEAKPDLQDQIGREPIESLDNANIDIIDQVVEVVSRFW
ncbi:MAG: histone deacetylase [Candidatus Thorarchaeota archaeon]|nr:histone deacetylase [Candidatus Thorarchaeota archaeon]